MFAQLRLSSACASEMSDQRLRFPPEKAFDPRLPRLRKAKILVS